MHIINIPQVKVVRIYLSHILECPRNAVDALE